MDFREIIKGSEYDFLRDDVRLSDNIILLTLGGSYAYGTNIATLEHTSDIDIRGIRLNSREEILTMNCDNKPYENKELDVVIYPLKQIISLLSSCNPNTLEIIGTREEDILYIGEDGRMLRNNVEVFLSQNAYNSFGGYALSQLKRLENTLEREGKDFDKVTERRVLKNAMHLIRLLITGSEVLSGKGINVYRKNERELLLDIRNGKYTYDEIFQIVHKYEEEFEYVAKHTTLPLKPDYNRINELVIEINKKVVEA
ncbi:MAG: nucleotidyltransferase domain-containing protein [Clostridium sp.]